MGYARESAAVVPLNGRTHEARPKPTRSARGRKPVPTGELEKKLRRAGNAFVEELFPAGRPPGFEIDLKTAEWRLGPTKWTRGRVDLWQRVRKVGKTEAARQIQDWLASDKSSLEQAKIEAPCVSVIDEDTQEIVYERLQTPKDPQTPLVSLTLIENSFGAATKVFSLSASGDLEKKSAAEIYEGSAKRIEVDGIEGFAKLLDDLQSSQALLYGTCDIKNAVLATQEALRERKLPNAIARDRQHFRFNENAPGILMFDHDPRPGHKRLDAKELDQILSEHVPGWSETARLWRPSSSAFIYRASDDAELIGLGGWRCYVVLDDAAAIPSVGAYIYQKLWSAGHGFIEISKSGQLLDRSIVDASVWQPERMDFAAAPIVRRGLIRRPPNSIILPGAPLLKSGRLIAPIKMSEWRKNSKELERARDSQRPKADAVRQRFVASRAAAMKAEGTTLADSRLREILTAAVINQSLSSDFALVASDGSVVTVGAILSDPARYNGSRFADPLEPDYRNDRRIAYANLTASPPYIFSHAHGGALYRLYRESADILIAKGELPRAVDETLEVIRARGDLYERAGEMVRLAGDGVSPVEQPYLADYLGRCIRYLGERADGTVRIDVPTKVCVHILAKTGERGLRRLDGIITAPTLRRNGSSLTAPGYDEDTGLLVVPSEPFAPIPEHPTHGELFKAYATLWKPFADFPFVTDADRGVMLAALLTAFIRRNLPFAPAFSFDAPQAGSGKTLLGLCLLRLCGMAPQALPDCGGEDELRKTLLSALREGKPGLLLDNIRDTFGSSALEAFLTAEAFSGRVLGATQMLSFSTNVLFLISGNNFLPKGDLWRRILTTRIDAKTADPERRAFRINPLEHCARHRQEMVAAGLTLLRGFIAAGKPRDKDAPDRLASFELWDDLIRQCVIWVGRQGIASVSDPTACIRLAKEREPERVKLGFFLETVWSAFKNKPWRTAELIEASNSNKELKEVLDQIAATRGKFSPHIFGNWISRQADVRFAGRRIVRDGTEHKVALWRIETDDPAEKRGGLGVRGGLHPVDTDFSLENGGQIVASENSATQAWTWENAL